MSDLQLYMIKDDVINFFDLRKRLWHLAPNFKSKVLESTPLVLAFTKFGLPFLYFQYKRG